MKAIEGGSGRPPEPNWTKYFPGANAKADRANASLYWNESADELQRDQKLSITNGHALRRLVTAYILYDREAAIVAKEGPIISAPKTGTPMHNPHAQAMRSLSRMAAEIEAELTLSPRRRSSGGKVPPPNKRTDADKYLKPVPNVDPRDD